MARKTTFSLNALEVLRDRYLWKKRSGLLETPEQMFDRVARHVAGASNSLKRRFSRALNDLAFLPNSPTLMNAGRVNGQLAACFVLPLEDDLSQIMDTLKATALIHQSGGGTGFSFSQLRAAQSEIASSRGTATGPIGFLSLFNELTQTIKQGGLRRGANMGVLSVRHPDIEDFIHCKSDTSKITNFNISVSVPDDFMKAVESGGSWALRDPRSNRKIRKVDAHALFKKISHAAWSTGEPGLIFEDEINRQNPTPKLGAILATNPCGEQPLLPFEACNLGSINLNRVLKLKGQGDYELDFQKLSELVETSVLFLDRVIDVCHYPLDEITTICRQNRKIGLGVMGLADMFLKLKIPYDSIEALEVSEKLMGFIRGQALQTSQALAKQKGPFSGFRQSLWHKRGFKPMRNATLTTIAPTGTISLIAGASAGIEPIFSYAYERHVLDGKILREVHPLFEKLIKNHALNEQVLSEAAQLGTLKNIQGLTKETKEIFCTARDIAPESHVRMQATFQKYSDSAVSKTINLPSSSTEANVEAAYRLAFELKCKGITVYRDTSRPNQVLKLQDCDDCARLP